MEESKVDNVEESWASITSIKNKDNIVDAYITSIKKKDDIFNGVGEPRDTSLSNRTNEITKFGNKTKPAELIISQENLYISVLYVLWASLEIITPDQNLIPCKNKRKYTPYFSILGKEPIPETVNPIKISQGDSLMPPEK